jgi:hypothetical protein
MSRLRRRQNLVSDSHTYRPYFILPETPHDQLRYVRMQPKKGDNFAQCVCISVQVMLGEAMNPFCLVLPSIVSS